MVLESSLKPSHPGLPGSLVLHWQNIQEPRTQAGGGGGGNAGGGRGGGSGTGAGTTGGFLAAGWDKLTTVPERRVLVFNLPLLPFICHPLLVCSNTLSVGIQLVLFCQIRGGAVIHLHLIYLSQQNTPWITPKCDAELLDRDRVNLLYLIGHTKGGGEEAP